MNIEQLYRLVGREDIDYSFIMAALRTYARPREKISAWLKNGSLIRVKKGLYVFGDQVRSQPYSLEQLANLIYGPSAISLHYALAFHGFIPERVTVITSITNKRNKQFSTPVGEFTYRYLNQHRYAIGIESRKSAAGYSFLIASPEKALCDLIYLESNLSTMDNHHEIEAYLFHELRLDEHALGEFNVIKLEQLAHQYQHAGLSQIVAFIRTRIDHE